MIKFILWVLIIYGITQIIVESELFEGFRQKVYKWSPPIGTLVHCMLCTSVWVSFIVSMILWSPTKAVFFDDILLHSVGDTQDIGINHFDMIIETIIDLIYSVNTAIINTGQYIFYDGMVGSVLVWWVSLLERMITNIIGFFNSYRNE